MASLMVGSHFNCFNYRDTWNVLENSWITHLILVLSLHRNCGYLLQLNAYEHECKDRPRTHILSRDAVGNCTPQVDARKDRDRDRDRDRDFHLQLLTSSFQVVVIILFWLSLINIHPHTFCVRESNTQWKMISTKRLLLQKGQNMFLFFD